MKIEHIAIWVTNLEAAKHFYETYFEATANDKYHNSTTGFQSYFMHFENGCRLELMYRPDIAASTSHPTRQQHGIIHFAISAGSREKVDSLTERLRADGFKIIGEPRTTGDGYYESVVLDPENNIVEITV